MPIQNIDNYVMPSRSQEASIYKTIEDEKIPAEQRYLADEVKSETDRNLERTGETKKSDLKDNSFDPRKKGNGEYSRQKKKDKKKITEVRQEKLPNESGRMIDIKL